MQDKLDLSQLKESSDFLHLEQAAPLELLDAFKRESLIHPYKPNKGTRTDPRKQLPVVYSEARSKRPILYDKNNPVPCPVCSGSITRSIDHYPIGDDEYCFINKNLYPLVYPHEINREDDTAIERSIEGLHFLLWPSNIHTRRIEHMTPREGGIVLSRLSALEEKMLHSNLDGYPVHQEMGIPDLHHRGWFGIIKNHGAGVGGSVEHDHFQMAYINRVPLGLYEDRLFFQTRNSSFPSWILEQNPPNLTVFENSGWKVVVPYFMKRPYDLLVICKNPEGTFLHHLEKGELEALSEVISKIVPAIEIILTRLDCPFAYNFVFHNSGFGQVYIEVLPASQNLGGFEHLGLFACQSSPDEAAQTYKTII